MASNAVFQSQYPWGPGGNLPGADVHSAPTVFTAQIQKQGGQRSFPPSVTAPGTTGTGTLVLNNTGYDCLVYLTATTGLGTVKVVSYNGAVASTISPIGSVASNTTSAVLVPGPGGIIPIYTGSLSWVWQPL